MVKGFTLLAKNRSLENIKHTILKLPFLIQIKLQHTLHVVPELKNPLITHKMHCRKKCTTEEPYYQYNFKPELEFAINEQIQAEQQAAQDYLNMAVFFLHPSVSWPGAGGFFMRMYEEEIGHMKNVIQYQLLRGGKVVMPCVAKPPTHDKLTMLVAFRLALQMEKTVTEVRQNRTVHGSHYRAI